MFAIVFLLLCGVALTSPNSLKEEILMAFADLPIDQGVRNIIDQSSLEFDHWKTQMPFTNGKYSETWKAELPEYKYLSRHNGHAILMINKEIWENKKCYDLAIKLAYQDSNFLNLDYDKLKSRLIGKGAIIEESTILGVPIMFKSGTLELDDEAFAPTFTFSMQSDSFSSGMTLLYEVCLK